MITRREAIKIGGAGAAVSMFGLGGWHAARAEAELLSLDAISARALNSTGIKVLANAERIAVPSYRFGVVVRSGISASGGQGTVQMEATVDLVGVSLEQLRQIADTAFADFLGQLEQTGRTIIPTAEMQASAGYAKLEMTDVPFIKKPFADARTVVMVSPNGMPLVNQHSDSPVTDKSPFALGNWRAINQMCVDLKCVVMIPSIVIDFAQLSGSGHNIYGSNANVGIRPGLYLVPLFTQLSGHHAKIALAGPSGKIILKERVVIGQAGEMVQTSSYNNRAEVDWWNSVGRWDTNATPMSSPGRAYDYSAYQYRVDQPLFAQACMDGAKAMNKIYAEAAATNRPG